MLKLSLEINEVNYKKCIESMLPSLVEHCRTKRNPNELDRFIAGLGKDAVPAVLSVLEKLDTDGRDRMAVWLVTSHEERMRNSANRHLAELLGGEMIRIGRFVATDEPGSYLLLQAAGVKIDYPALLKCPLVGEGVEQIGSEHAILKGAAKLALQMGSKLSPESLEKYCVTLLNSGKIKPRLMSALTDGLRQAGLEATVTDMTVAGDDALPGDSPNSAVPVGFEKELMDALTAWIRENRGESMGE